MKKLGLILFALVSIAGCSSVPKMTLENECSYPDLVEQWEATR